MYLLLYFSIQNCIFCFLFFLKYISIKKEITAVNKVFLRYAHSRKNENDNKNPDDPRNTMMIKIMIGIFTGYVMLYVLSLLLPNSSSPEVNI